MDFFRIRLAFLIASITFPTAAAAPLRTGKVLRTIAVVASSVRLLAAPLRTDKVLGTIAVVASSVRLILATVFVCAAVVDVALPVLTNISTVVASLIIRGCGIVGSSTVAGIVAGAVTSSAITIVVVAGTVSGTVTSSAIAIVIK